MAAGERLICASGDVVDGGAGVRFTVQRQGIEEPAFVVRFSGLPRAYLNRCAHTPIELDWNAGEFFDDSRLYLICAMHGALYAPESGRCLGGRCRGHGGLQPIAVKEHDGGIYLVETNEQ